MMDNKLVGVITTLALLLGGVSGSLLVDFDKDKTYICTATEQVGVFNGGISSSGITAYPFKENRTQPKQCSGGKWVKLSTYAEEKGIAINEFLQPKEIKITESENIIESKKWVCDVEKCIKVE